MRKFTFLTLLFVLISPMASHASTIGDPETLGKNKWGVGLDGDYVYNRPLKSETWSTRQTIFARPAGITEFVNYDMETSKLKITEMYRTSAKVSYGLLESLDVYLKLGTSQKQIRGSFSGSGVAILPPPTNTLAATIYNGSLKYSTENAFTYGGGVKLTHEFNEGWSIGVLGQYLREESNYKASRQYIQDLTGSPGIFSFEDWHGELTTQEWSIAPYLAKKIKNFTPYVGFVYTILRMKDRARLPTSIASSSSSATEVIDLSREGYTLKFDNKRSIGPFVGLNYKFNDRWSINIEGRFVDETAISLEGNCIF